MKEFPPREALMTMPLKVLRGLDIETPEQQGLVQEIVNERMSTLPPERPVYRNDVPDIKTPEEEMRWQQIIDERTARLRNREFIQEETPIVEAVPSTPEIGPQGQQLAQPTGEGEPVSFNAGVPSMLTSQTESPKRKPGRPAKVK